MRRTYVIGDLQGCFDPLQQLLNKIQFSPNQDTLWFTGDLINRGQQSLETLQFVKNLSSSITVLGNHDLHFLAVYYGHTALKPNDTFHDLLSSPDVDSLVNWLLQQPLIHYDQTINATLVHAGIPPQWTHTEALSYANEVEMALQDPNQRHDFFRNLYGDKPSRWKEKLHGIKRLRYITNALTRIRYVTKRGRLALRYKGRIEDTPKRLYPWFLHPDRQTQHDLILFGHWAALEGITDHPNALAIDTGCCWGNCLTALCLETGERICVDCQ